MGVTKNFIRIIHSDNSFLPNIYKDDYVNLEMIKIIDNQNNFLFYKMKNNDWCGYAKSPCTHYVKNLKLLKFDGYRIYVKQDQDLKIK